MSNNTDLSSIFERKGMAMNYLVSNSHRNHSQHWVSTLTGRPISDAWVVSTTLTLTFKNAITTEFAKRVAACLPKSSFLWIRWTYRKHTVTQEGDRKLVYMFWGEDAEGVRGAFLTNLLRMCADEAAAQQ